MTRRSHKRWGGRRHRRARLSGVERQTPPGGLLLLAVAGVVVYHSAQPAPVESSQSDVGDRLGAWVVDSAVDVLEVIAGAGGNPT